MNLLKKFAFQIVFLLVIAMMTALSLTVTPAYAFDSAEEYQNWLHDISTSESNESCTPIEEKISISADSANEEQGNVTVDIKSEKLDWECSTSASKQCQHSFVKSLSLQAIFQATAKDGYELDKWFVTTLKDGQAETEESQQFPPLDFEADKIDVIAHFKAKDSDDDDTEDDDSGDTNVDLACDGISPKVFKGWDFWRYGRSFLVKNGFTNESGNLIIQSRYGAPTAVRLGYAIEPNQQGTIFSVTINDGNFSSTLSIGTISLRHFGMRDQGWYTVNSDGAIKLSDAGAGDRIKMVSAGKNGIKYYRNGELLHSAPQHLPLANYYGCTYLSFRFQASSTDSISNGFELSNPVFEIFDLE